MLTGGGVEATFREGCSDFEGTRTLVTTYDGPVPGKGDQVATLEYIHFYDAEKFLEKLERIGFDILYPAVPYTDLQQAAQPDFLECLVRPRRRT